MAEGLQVWDASGNIILNETTKTGRLLDVIETGLSNGSFTFTGAIYGDMHAAAITSSIYPPSVTVSGNVVSWTFPGNKVNASILLFEI